MDIKYDQIIVASLMEGLNQRLKQHKPYSKNIRGYFSFMETMGTTLWENRFIAKRDWGKMHSKIKKLTNSKSYCIGSKLFILYQSQSQD